MVLLMPNGNDRATQHHLHTPDPDPIIVENSNTTLSPPQIMGTALLMPNGNDCVTVAPLQP